MARWQPAKTRAELWQRITRQLRVRRVPNAVRRRAREQGYLTEAFRLQAGEAALRRFVRAELGTIRRRVLGYRAVGGKREVKAEQVYDQYTRLRWEAGAEADEPPAGYSLGKRHGRDVILLYARPWVPPSVVARLYTLGRASFPTKMIHGPHLKSLHLYLYVTDAREAGQETWKETMERWNEHAEDSGLPNTYTLVHNFWRDYHRIARTLVEDDG